MFDKAAEFRKFLQNKGHSLVSRDAKTFYLDLNQGGMRIEASKHELRRFVKDMQEFFGNKEYTEMNAINQLVAERKSFYEMNDRIYWHRPYHVNYNEYPEKYITFEDYIKEYVR